MDKRTDKKNWKKTIDEIFWTVDRFLMKHPLLEHIRFAWNRFYSIEVVTISGKRVKYVRTIKYMLISAILVLLMGITGGIIVMFSCCSIATISLRGQLFGLVGMISFVLLMLLMSLALTIVVGPIFMGIFSFFIREEMNDFVEPTHSFVFYSDPFYRRYMLTANIIYFIVAVLHLLLIGFINAINPLKGLPLMGFFTFLLIGTLTTWATSYLIFEFLFRLEAERLKQGETSITDEHMKDDVTVVAEETEYGRKEIKGVMITMEEMEGETLLSDRGEMTDRFDLRFFLEKAGFKYPTDVADIVRSALKTWLNSFKSDEWIRGIISVFLIYLGFSLLLIPTLVTFPVGMLSLTRLYHQNRRLNL